jgi:death on curing protein
VTRYITVAEALFFHRQLVSRYGGAQGVRDLGALEAALHRPRVGYYDDLVHEAAALFESLVQNHPFVDGNKRVAFAVVDVFLRINGYRITADAVSIHVKMMELFAAQTFDMAHLVPWLSQIVESR